MSWTRITGARVFAPEDLGTTDILIWRDRIVAVGTGVTPPAGAACTTVDASGRILLPGLIDPHIHIMGASGTAGPASRTPDLPISRITSAGVTTVVSPLGGDSLGRSPHGLVLRGAAASAEGISAYAYTGGWRNPAPTITGDVQTDVALIDRILGVKVAVAEAMAPPLSTSELGALAHAAVSGGRIAGKRSVLHAHIGDRPEGLTPVLEAAEATGLPLDRFVTTHVNRNHGLWEQALAFGAEGGSIDITAQVQKRFGYANPIEPGRAVTEALDRGVPIERITLSSDSGAAYPAPDGSGPYLAGPEELLPVLREIVGETGSWETATHVGAASAANLLGLDRKGRISEGADADLLLLSDDGEVCNVWCRGQLMVETGQPVVRGSFE
jgi:beta-aspartyl-dipeptidase (metallo-type)